MTQAKRYLVGPHPGEPLTLKEIADKEGVTISAIRRRLYDNRPLLRRPKSKIEIEKAKAAPIRRKEDEWPAEEKETKSENLTQKEEDEPWLEEWSEK